MKKVLFSIFLLLSMTSAAFADIIDGYICHANQSNEEYIHSLLELISNDEYMWDNYAIDRPEYAKFWRKWKMKSKLLILCPKC